MTDRNPKHSEQKSKLGFFNFLLEVFGWLRIFASPFFIGLAIGFGVYTSKPDEVGFVIAATIAIIGFILGIILATRIWKKKGTLNYISTIMSSPDLDKFDEEN